jgi:hypothetical protein
MRPGGWKLEKSRRDLRTVACGLDSTGKIAEKKTPRPVLAGALELLLAAHG